MPGFGAETQLQKRSISKLEQQRDAIESELNQLAALSLRSAVGTIGFRSKEYPDPHHTEWIQIELGQETALDQIALVPAIWHEAQTGFQADGFPLEFQLIAGTADDTNGTVVASCGAQDQLLPRIAPLVINCPGTIASWVRLQATKLSERKFDGQYNLELSEIMVFSGAENVALHQPVTSSSSAFETSWRNKNFLVDGFTPFLMDAAQGEKSLAAISAIDPEYTAALTIDLGAPQPVDRIQLHSVEQNDTVPRPYVSGAGVPPHLAVDGANRADFSDAIRLLDIHSPSEYGTGPVITHRLPGTACRYIRLTAIKPYTYLVREDLTRARFGFAEVELFSRGKNVALNRPVSANFELLNPARSLAALTDGRNLYGNILPIRDWINQLARRHDLEKERTGVTDLLNKRYARQQVNVRRLIWLAVLLAAGIVLAILIEKIRHMRHAALIRERFAADLHDELGANLHAIGILGTHIKDILDSPEKLTRTVDEIKSLTDRTGEATRYCSDMQADDIHADLAADLKRTARRIMANLHFSFEIQGEEFLKQLKPRARADLFLFFKESLININRHADATKVQIALTADAQQICLCISDNGCGITGNETIPASLQRRAKLLKATVSLKTSELGGACISLQLRLRKRRK